MQQFFGHFSFVSISQNFFHEAPLGGLSMELPTTLQTSSLFGTNITPLEVGVVEEADEVVNVRFC